MPTQMTKRIGAVVGDSVPPYAGMRVVSFLFFHPQVLDVLGIVIAVTPSILPSVTIALPCFFIHYKFANT